MSTPHDWNKIINVAIGKLLYAVLATYVIISIPLTAIVVVPLSLAVFGVVRFWTLVKISAAVLVLAIGLGLTSVYVSEGNTGTCLPETYRSELQRGLDARKAGETSALDPFRSWLPACQKSRSPLEWFPHPVRDSRERQHAGSLRIPVSQERSTCESHDIVATAEGLGISTRTTVDVLAQNERVWTVEERALETVKCDDLTGDGKPELLLTTFSGGAHCCYSVHVLQLGTPVKELLNFDSGSASGVELRESKRGIGLVLADPSFDYFADLSHVESPYLPLVACFKDDHFEDCTQAFPDVVQSAEYGILLHINKLREGKKDYGAALGAYAGFVLLGREEDGLRLVGEVSGETDVMSWLSAERQVVHKWAESRQAQLEGHRVLLKAAPRNTQSMKN